MATQYIEDPDTKERIPFEWDKPTPPTPDDISGLFKSVKSARTSTLGARSQPPGTDILTTGEPTINLPSGPYMPSALSGARIPLYGAARTALDIAGITAGGIIGGPPGAGIGHAISQQAKQLIPGTPPRPADKMDFEKALGSPISDAEYQDILQGGPQWQGLYTKMGFTSPSAVEKVLSKAGEVGMDFATGYGLEAGARALPIPKILPMYARGRTPAATEVANIANREGVTIPAADVTGSTGQSAITSSLQKLPQSAKTMQTEANKTMGDFANYVDRTLAKTGGRVEPTVGGEVATESIHKPFAERIESLFKPTGGKTTPISAGENAQTGISTARKAAEREGGDLYRLAKDAEKDTPISFTDVVDEIATVRSSDRYKLLSETGKKDVDNFISLIKSRIGKGTEGEVEIPTAGGAFVPAQLSKGGGKGFIDQSALEGVAKESDKIKTFFEAEGLRKSLGENVFGRGAKKLEAYGPKKQIYDAFESDMENSASTDLFKQARTNWATNVIDKFGAPGKKNILTKIEAASPEEVVPMLKSANVDELKHIVSVLPKKELSTVQNGILTDLVGAGASKTRVGDIVYNGPQIKKALESIGDDKLSVLFDPSQVSYLHQVAESGSMGKGALFRLSGSSPEQAIQRLKSAPLNELKMIKGNLKSDEFVKFRQGFLTQLFEKNGTRSPITGETIYNGPQIAKELFGKGGLGEERLKHLVSPQELQFLKDFAKVGAKVGDSWRIAGNPSGTAHTLYTLHLMGAVGAGLGNLVAEAAGGGKETRIGGALAGAGAFLSPYVLAKLITSNIGRRYLISGFPAAEKAIQRVLPPGIIGTRGMLSKEPEKLALPTTIREKKKE